MSRHGTLVLVTTAVIASACAPRKATQGSAAADTAAIVTPGKSSRLPVVPLDSATIYRLCAKPDSVYAGKAECVLNDQGLPLETVPPRPLPPASRTPPPLA